MQRFRYWLNAPFVVGCVAYAANRWLIKPQVDSAFMQHHFNDLWMIPCALPPLLWLYRRLGLRTHDKPPGVWEILLHLVFWSAFCEWLGPALVSHSTGDPWDVAAYTVGAVLAGLWWHRRWLSSSHHEL